MTTPSAPTRSERCDIPTLHDAIAPVGVLQRERRALYQFAVELLSPSAPGALGSDVIDSPIARHHIGEALAGRSGLAFSDLTGIAVTSGAGVAGSRGGLPVVSRPEAVPHFAAALATVGNELARQRAASGPPELLTAADGERFDSALSVLGDGVTLARSISPGLTDDLLPHIALIGIVDPQRTGRLASASPRNFPGLVLLEGLRSGIDAAEALVHEGAHQKFFDLAITRDLLDVESDRCPPFRPPWAPEGRQWPLEQALAAGHAYACLARFAHDAGVSMTRQVASPHSLLPVANERCEIVGQWLLSCGSHLGPSAHTLLEGLLGRRPHIPAADHPSPTRVGHTPRAGLLFRRFDCIDRVLVGRTTSPPQLCWLHEDAATLLESLGHRALDDVIDYFAHRWSLPRCDTHARLARLLSDLSASDLVTT